MRRLSTPRHQLRDQPCNLILSFKGRNDNHCVHLNLGRLIGFPFQITQYAIAAEAFDRDGYNPFELSQVEQVTQRQGFHPLDIEAFLKQRLF